MGCCVQENRLNTHLSLQPLFTGLCSCRRRGISRVLVRERRYLTGLMRDGRRRANQSAQKTLHSPRNVWWTGRSHCRADCGAFRGVTSPAEVGKVLGPVEQRGPGGWVVGTASFFTYCNNRGSLHWHLYAGQSGHWSTRQPQERKFSVHANCCPDYDDTPTTIRLARVSFSPNIFLNLQTARQRYLKCTR